jgi:hypothetical protein
VEFVRQNTGEENAARENSGDLLRIFLGYSASYSQACEETVGGWGKNHLKGFERVTRNSAYFYHADWKISKFMGH